MRNWDKTKNYQKLCKKKWVYNFGLRLDVKKAVSISNGVDQTQNKFTTSEFLKFLKSFQKSNWNCKGKR